MKQAFKSLLLAVAFAVFANVSWADDYTFTNGIVFAKIIGPNKWTKETAESKFDPKTLNYFYTTIEVVSTKDSFSQELKGRKLRVMTGDFDKDILDKTVAVHLIRRTDKAGKIQFLFDCSSLSLAMKVADGQLKNQK